MKNFISVGLISMFLIACNAQADIPQPTRKPVPTRTPKPNYKATDQAVLEKYPKPEDFFSEERVVIEDTALGVTFYKTDLRGIVWSPDGEKIAGYIKWEYVYPISTSNIIDFSCDPCFQSEIYIWDRAVTTYRKISQSNFEGEKRTVYWSSEDKIFWWDESGKNFDELILGYLDLQTKEYVGIQNYTGFSYGWMPNGHSLIDVNFNIIDFETGETETIERLADEFERSFSIRYAQQNGLIVFSSREGIPYPIYIYNIESDSIQKVIDGETDEIFTLLDLFPDENWVLYESEKYIDSDFEYEYFAYNLSTQCTTDALKFPSTVFAKTYSAKLTETNYENTISWSPDGQTLTIPGEIYGVGSGVFFMDMDGAFIQDWLSSGSCSE